MLYPHLQTMSEQREYSTKCIYITHEMFGLYIKHHDSYVTHLCQNSHLL